MRIKKLLASLLLGTMILGSGITAFATEPVDLDTTEVVEDAVVNEVATEETASIPEELLGQWDIVSWNKGTVGKGDITLNIEEDGTFVMSYPKDELVDSCGYITITDNGDNWYGDMFFAPEGDYANETFLIDEEGQLVLTAVTADGDESISIYVKHKTFLDYVTEINDAINGLVWVKTGLWLLLGTGVLMTIVTGVFQITHLPHWMKKTIGSVFKKESHNKDQKGAVSQFQALCTALAATIGTGNIAGVAAAICVGGPGAVFWMWIAAFFGMMTNFSENVLGIYYRRRNSQGEWSGGAMYYLQDGLGSKKGFKAVGKVLGIIFSLCAILASFGIGNLGQINKIVFNINSAFFSKYADVKMGSIPLVPFFIGVCLMIVGGFIIVGGLKRIAAVAERVVPFMAVAYVIGTIIIIVLHWNLIIPAFISIFKLAFGVKAVAGGATGIAIMECIKQGCKRGVFSNEAGLGSSVMVHSNSDVKEPVKQGLWGIFEVFADTMVVCTMTALVCLTSGFIDLANGNFIAPDGVSDANLVAKAFGGVFGAPGEWFIAVAILLFAFTTVLGWSHYGSKAVEYLVDEGKSKKSKVVVIIYRIVFVLAMMAGALATSSLAWDISDTFNGMMMIPNLIGVICLFPLVKKITDNYVARKLKGNTDVEPMLSFDPEIQKIQAEAVKNGEE